MTTDVRPFGELVRSETSSTDVYPYAWLFDNVAIIEVEGSGGGTGGGAADQVVVTALEGAGGGVGGGEADTLGVLELEGAGGALGGGLADLVLEVVLEAAGGGVGGGAADVVLIAPVSITVVGEGGGVGSGQAVVQVFIIDEDPGRPVYQAEASRSSRTVDLDTKAQTAALVASTQEARLA